MTANRVDEIRHMSEEEKLHAAEGIENLPFDENRALVVLLLGDESYRVRKTALEALLNTHQSDKLFPLFIDIINAQDNAGLRTAGVEGLMRIGPAAVGHIIKAIDPEEWELSKLLVDVLGDIGDARALPVLLKLTASTQQNLSTAAVEALGKLGTEETIPALAGLLKKKEIYIVFSTLEALANLGRKGFDLPIQDILPLMDDPLLKKAVFDLLGSAHDPSVIPYLIEGIKDTKRSNRDAAAKALFRLYNGMDPECRDAVKQGVMKSGISGTYVVEKILSGVDHAVIAAGLRLLGWTGMKSSIGAIFKYAEEPDLADTCVLALVDLGEPVRSDVVGLLVGNKNEAQLRAGLGYLAQLPESRTAPPEGLSYLLEFEDAPDILGILARVLGRYIDERSLRLLTRLMVSDDKDVNRAAVENFTVVGRYRAPAAADMIHGMAHSNDPMLRLSSAKLLASFSGEQADADITTLLNDSEPAVRAAMIATVGALKLGKYLEDLQVALADESRDVRIEAVRAVGSLEPGRFIDIVQWLIKDKDPWVKIEIIKHLKDAPQTDEARKILREYTDDEFPAVILTALQTLIDLSIDTCTEEIEKVLSGKDEDVVLEAMYMIGRTGTETANVILKGLGSSDNPKIRERAASLLGKYDLHGDKQ